MRLAVFCMAFLIMGCVARQEIREQHCAHLALDRHGALQPSGAYGTWTRGRRCSALLWNRRVVNEGVLDDKWRPE